MDDAILTFLQEKVNSFVKWDLIRFFHDNPHTKDTAENIARYTGRDKIAVAHELDELVLNGVLKAEMITNYRVYCLVDDIQTRQLIERFMDACHDREFRVEAINQVIKQMQFSPRHDF
ncbi:MAG: hypothetical protein Kow00117_06610 [Phototrophicales bacterium]|nr:MAG: hypothetical protein CUN56_05595 [Phototrophicales bacterium]RMG70751.1 MAG: hypothetical protein D6711_16600 [Chloroflexota bacterium]